MMRIVSFIRRRASAVAAALFVLMACAPDAISPGTPGWPPYLAVVVFVDAPPEVTSRGPYSFRVRELSGTLDVDTTVRGSPTDTVIMSVKPATYRVEISDVPPTCGVRDTTWQDIVVPPNANTSLLRFFINCEPALVVATYTDGPQADTDYVVTVQGANTELAALMTGNDSLRVEALAPGAYTVSLRNVASNCVVTSDGGEHVAIAITPSGGVFLPFRVVCSDVARRPRIVQLSGSYAGGSMGYVIRAADPDEDIERTFVDVTACDHRSILPGGGRRRGGFSGYPNVTQRDTAVILGAYDLALSDSALAGRCIAAWVADERGNTSDVVEVPLVARQPAHAPGVAAFNAKLNGAVSLQVDVNATDPDGDLLGVFVTYLLRDGIVSLPADGVPDRLVNPPPGLLGTTVPLLPFDIGLGQWSDYLGVVVFLIDKSGNFTRLEDGDLFR